MRKIGAPTGSNSLLSLNYSEVPRGKAREYELAKALQNCLEPGHNSSIYERARKRMARVDAMEPDIRAVVYDFGLEIVQPLIDHRVSKAEVMRELIHAVLNAERPHGQRIYTLFRHHRRSASESLVLGFGLAGDLRGIEYL